MNKAIASASVAALAKAGTAFGVGSSVEVAGAACGTNASVVRQVGLIRADNGQSVGSVSLWYSSACRTVAAQSSHPNIVCNTGAGCGTAETQLTNQAVTASCVDPTNNSTGCKTGFVNDANIVQRAVGWLDLASTSASGATGFF
jgi:hypothetical protein